MIAFYNCQHVTNSYFDYIINFYIWLADRVTAFRLLMRFLQPQEIIAIVPDLITLGGELNNKLSILQWLAERMVLTNSVTYPHCNELCTLCQCCAQDGYRWRCHRHNYTQSVRQNSFLKALRCRWTQLQSCYIVGRQIFCNFKFGGKLISQSLLLAIGALSFGICAKQQLKITLKSSEDLMKTARQLRWKSMKANFFIGNTTAVSGEKGVGCLEQQREEQGGVFQLKCLIARQPSQSLSSGDGYCLALV